MTTDNGLLLHVILRGESLLMIIDSATQVIVLLTEWIAPTKYYICSEPLPIAKPKMRRLPSFAVILIDMCLICDALHV